MRSATLAQCSDPVWEPLIAVVGLAVVGEFMWMSELTLDDGTEVHAYKHRATRRYLHLGCDGRAFMYVSSGRYVELPLREALEEAFTNWETLIPAPAEPDAVRALLHRHGACVT